MFVLTKQSVVDRGIAAVLAAALVCWSVGAHYSAQAAGLTNITDVLSTSAPSAGANHTITFTVPTGATAQEGVADDDDEIRLTFPAGFNIASIVDTDIDIDVDGAGDDAMGPGGWTSGVSGQVLTLTSTGGRLAPGEEIVIEIGTNATFGVTGTNQIVNPGVTGSGELLIEIYDDGTTSVVSSNSTVLVVTDQVVVTADVDPIFNFFVTGTTTGEVIDTETMTATTTSTAIPFGTLVPGTPGIAAQELGVVTNAVGGFSVTVFTDQQLTASNGADIDTFIDGATTSVPTAWQSPAGTIGSNDTYGHWGLRSSDADLGTAFAAGSYEAVPDAASPREVFAHDEPTDRYNSPLDAGYTQVLYKAEVMSFQEAADDYTATLTYVATPTF